MNLFWRLLLAIEMIFWHNLQIKSTTETEDTLRTDSTFCSDMAIWEQETGVLYQIVVYGGQGALKHFSSRASLEYTLLYTPSNFSIMFSAVACSDKDNKRLRAFPFKDPLIACKTDEPVQLPGINTK